MAIYGEAIYYNISRVKPVYIYIRLCLLQNYSQKGNPTDGPPSGETEYIADNSYPMHLLPFTDSSVHFYLYTVGVLQ